MTTKEKQYRELLDECLNTAGELSTLYKAFYRYSFCNQLTIRWGLRTSGKDIQPTQTYKGWQSAGRQVRQGEKAVAGVWIPVEGKCYTCKGEGKDEGGLTCDKCSGSGKYFGFRFKDNCQFAVDQTGIPCPDCHKGQVERLDQTSDQDVIAYDDCPSCNGSGWAPDTGYVPDEAPEFNYERALQTLKITLEKFSDTNAGTMGYAYRDRIAISPLCDHPKHTFYHELTHSLLHCFNGSRIVDLDKTRWERHIREFQAEATAYIICGLLDIEIEGQSSSRAYVQTWLQGEEQPSDEDIKQVFKAVDTILKAGRDS